MANDQTGFIIDSPNVLVKTKAKDLIIDKAESGSVAFSGDFIDINAGWSFTQLAKIPKSSKIEIKITNAEFSLNQTAIATGADIVVGATEYNKFGDIYVVDVSNTITIPDVVVAGSLRINGYTETTSTVATGQFKVTIGVNSTTVQFFTDVEKDTQIKPSYKVTTPSTSISLSAKVTSVPGSGEFVVTYPLYESDSVESNIWAYGQFIIYKAAIAQSFTAGGNYKSASKFDLSATALNPQRPDKKLWDFILLPVATASDTTPPTIVSVVPANAATAVVATAPIVFTFSEAVNPSTTTSSNILVVKSTDGSIVPGTFVLSAGNTVATFTAATSLSASTKYFVTATTDITDVSGNHLAANSVSSFTTA